MSKSPEPKKDDSKLTVRDIDPYVLIEELMKRVAKLENEVAKLKKKGKQ